MPTSRRRVLVPLADRGPLRTLFVITSMPVGGAETLLANLVRRIDRDRLLPEICCLKELGPLGESLMGELPLHRHLLTGKWDVRVLTRLRQLLRIQRIDAVVTVGAGDKMFWGRLAAWLEHLPVVCSALHSTGWPDSINFLNRRLTPITDAFVAVAEPHGKYLIEHERFPADKVRIIPNGVDTERFRPAADSGRRTRRACGIPDQAPVVGIVAALRPEKNHAMLLQAAAQIVRQQANTHFLIVGDGPERASLEQLTGALGLRPSVHFLGNRPDIPDLLAAMDVFVLTSHNEANPVSILEALACGVPVVAPRVGSIPETVIPGQTGMLFPAGDTEAAMAAMLDLLADGSRRVHWGQHGRALVEARWSLAGMVRGYEDLIASIYSSKVGEQSWRPFDPLAATAAGS